MTLHLSLAEGAYTWGLKVRVLPRPLIIMRKIALISLLATVIGATIGLHLEILFASCFEGYDGYHIPTQAAILIPITSLGLGFLTFATLVIIDVFTNKFTEIEWTGGQPKPEPKIHPAVLKHFDERDKTLQQINKAAARMIVTKIKQRLEE